MLLNINMRKECVHLCRKIVKNIKTRRYYSQFTYEKNRLNH